jgi:hypothetical protein
MNTLFGLAAVPKAANVAANATSSALGALTQPFGRFFQAAVEESDGAASAAAEAAAAEAATLHERIAQQLQELLASLGAGPDEEVAIRFDEFMGELHVDGHHSASAVESALRRDSQLLADLQRLAELQSEFDPSVSAADWELRARVSESGGAQLRWR